MSYKQDRRTKILAGISATFVVLMLIIAIVYGDKKDKKFKFNQVVKNDQELLEVLKDSGDKRLTFDKSIPVNDFNKQIITPASTFQDGAFDKLENGDLKSNINTYYVNFQVIKTDDNGIQTGVLSSTDVFIDGKVNEISKYEDDAFNNSQYTFKTKDTERIKWDVTFSYPEKFIKELVNNFNNDKTNKKNNVVMKYNLNIGVDRYRDEKGEFKDEWWKDYKFNN